MCEQQQSIEQTHEKRSSRWRRVRKKRRENPQTVSLFGENEN